PSTASPPRGWRWHVRPQTICRWLQILISS
ncbi:uncharacterized protein METZ01_LOCUS301682, partial [marine metagenome]